MNNVKVFITNDTELIVVENLKGDQLILSAEEIFELNASLAHFIYCKHSLLHTKYIEDLDY